MIHLIKIDETQLLNNRNVTMAEKNSMYTYQWMNETKKDDKSFIRIYGISQNGDNICVRVRGFKRYVYVELPTRSAEPTVSRMAIEHGAASTRLLSRHHLYYFKKDKKFPFLKCNFTTLKQLSRFIASLRHFVMIPGVGRVKLKVHEDHATPVLQLISTQNLKMAGWIDFTGKVLPKEDQITSCAKEYVVKYEELKNNDRHAVIKPKVLSFDLEVNSENINCMPCDKPGDRIFQISCVFNDGRSILLTLPNCNKLEGVTVMTFVKEKDLIVGFIDLLKNEKPNVVTGYNILSFDIPYLLKRCKRYYLTEDLKLAGYNLDSPAKSKEVNWSSSAFRNQHFEFIDWEGILLFDLLPIIRRDYKLDNYKLNTVAAKFVGAEKDPLTPKDIFAAYRNGEVTEVGKYCIKDSELVLKLFNHLQIWVAFSEMAKVCNVGMFTLYTQGQQVKIYSQVYKYCFDKKIVVDTDGYIATSDEQYRGASVLEPEPGYYEDVVPFDFSSLYPSLMQAWNICFSSAVNDESVPDELCHVFEWEDHIGCEHDQKTIEQRQLKSRIDKIVTKQKKIRTERDAIKLAPVLQEVKTLLRDGEIDCDSYLKAKIMKEAKKKYNNTKSEAYKSIREIDPFVEEAIKNGDNDTLRELIEDQKSLEKKFKEINIEPFKQTASDKIQADSLGNTKKRTALEKDIARAIVAKRRREFDNQISKLNDEAKPLRERREDLVKTKPEKPMCSHRRYRFYKAENQTGIIPSIITELLQARKTVRAKIKETDDPLEKVVYDKQQLAYKVSANSIYGGMGTQRGMLAYMPGAMCVTMKGREALLQAQQLLTQKHNATLIYSDTDSCYVKFPWIKDPTELWDHCLAVEKELVPQFPPPIKLAFEEIIYRKFLILSKKRYMWQSCVRDGVLDTNVGRKGVLLARRDNSKFTRSVYEKIMSMLFDKMPKIEIETWLNNKLDALFRCELPLTDYVITKSIGDTSGEYEEDTSTLGAYKVKALSDDLDERQKQLQGRTEREYYISSMPAHVRLAEKMKVRGFPVDAGSRIEYVVLKRAGARNQGDKIEELEYYKERKHLLKIDPTYYLETLQKPIDQLCKAGLKDPEFMTKHEKSRMNHQKMILQLKNTFSPKIVK